MKQANSLYTPTLLKLVITKRGKRTKVSPEGALNLDNDLLRKAKVIVLLSLPLRKQVGTGPRQG